MKTVNILQVVCAFLLSAQPSLAEQSLQFDLKDLADICSGLQTQIIQGGQGTVTANGDYTITVSPDRTLTIKRSGQLISKIVGFTYESYVKCVADLASALVKPSPQRKACRLPSADHVESFRNEFDVTRDSGWRGGGYDPARWCLDVVNALRGEHPAVGSVFEITGSTEKRESKCNPFNCPQYFYTCTVHVKTDPLYKLVESPDCP